MGKQFEGVRYKELVVRLPLLDYVGARTRIGTPDAAARASECIRHLAVEAFVVLLLDTRKGLIETPSASGIGAVDGCMVEIATVFRRAIIKGARKIIFIHNHPSNDPSPSPEDIRVTKGLVEAGKILGIELMDSIIVTADSHVSLRESGCVAFT